jgi:Raf kinase inhibitor-like YbhB/YbcL family protein
MVKNWISLILAFAFVSLAVASSMGGEKMQLTSSAFQDGGKIPIQYVMPGAGGKNVSIPLGWKNPPEGTKSFAISIVDPHPVANDWVHWLVIDIPPSTTGLPEGASGGNMPQSSVELNNSFGAIGYGGPQPPRGTGDHPYVVTLYALRVERLELSPNAGLIHFKNTLRGKVLAEAGITGYFGR